MDKNEYQKLAMRTAPDITNDEKRINAQMGLIGESGEVVDALKKWRFQSGNNHPLPQEKLVDEIGDVYWYIALYLDANGLHMDDLPKLTKRDTDNSIGMCDMLTDTAMTAAATAAKIYVYSDDMVVLYLLANLMRLYEEILERIGSDADACMEHNIRKLMKRYPNGFDPERSLNRSK